MNVEVVPFGERADQVRGPDRRPGRLDRPALHLQRLRRPVRRPAVREPQRAALFGALDTSAFVPAILPILSSRRRPARPAGPLRDARSTSTTRRCSRRRARSGEPARDLGRAVRLRAAADRRQPVSVRGPVAGDFGSGAYWLDLPQLARRAALLTTIGPQVLFDNDDGPRVIPGDRARLQGQVLRPEPRPDRRRLRHRPSFQRRRDRVADQLRRAVGAGRQRQRHRLPATIDPAVVGAIDPAGRSRPARSGSINGFEGFGINKFSVQKEAALHFLAVPSRASTIQKAMNMTARRCLRAATDVLNDPEVVAVYPLGAVLVGAGQLQPRPLWVAVRLVAARHRRRRQAVQRRVHRGAGARGGRQGRRRTSSSST